ncbi:hypothetical protein IGI39_004280 [Enterococcus sp. AZ135]
MSLLTMPIKVGGVELANRLVMPPDGNSKVQRNR